MTYLPGEAGYSDRGPLWQADVLYALSVSVGWSFCRVIRRHREWLFLLVTSSMSYQCPGWIFSVSPTSIRVTAII